MARSVSVPYNARTVVYSAIEIEDSWEWEDLIENLVDALRARYPSLRGASGWIGREDRVILQNDLARVTVSEYCGLVAVCLVPNEDNPLADAWVNRIDAGFRDTAGAALGNELICVGRFSNGEAIYQPRRGPVTKGELGLGYSSKEGWL